MMFIERERNTADKMGRKKKTIVGRKNYEMKPVSKPLINLIVSFQKDLQDKENKRKKYKPRKISFVYASLKLSKIMKENAKK